jgi:hypothetical protein
MTAAVVSFSGDMVQVKVHEAVMSSLDMPIFGFF